MFKRQNWVNDPSINKTKSYEKEVLDFVSNRIARRYQINPKDARALLMEALTFARTLDAIFDKIDFVKNTVEGDRIT